jgi:hypothetical protein
MGEIAIYRQPTNLSNQPCKLLTCPLCQLTAKWAGVYFKP